MIFAGVDIGGTNTKVYVSGKFVKFATPRNKSELCLAIADTIRLLAPKVDGVGIACPGAVIGKEASFFPNLNIAPFDGSEIASALGVPVLLVNDGDAAAYGESVYGGYKDLVFITLGTGVGGGIILDGKPYRGLGCAGEIGHMVICVDGRKCGCGMKGCLEAYASATALEASYREKAGIKATKNKNAIEIFCAADNGDEAARAAVEEFYDSLSVGIINICNILRPKVIIIGGGVSNRADLIDCIKQRCEKTDYGYKNAPVPLILRAKLSEKAGAIGAMELIKNKIEEKKYERS